MKGVTLFNFFEVPDGADEEFLAGWERAREVIDGKGGFRWTALHRSLQPQAEFRYVNVAEIESVEAWQAAVMDPAFPRDMPGTPHPGLYEPIREDPTAQEVEGVILINPSRWPTTRTGSSWQVGSVPAIFFGSTPAISAPACTAAFIPRSSFVT